MVAVENTSPRKGVDPARIAEARRSGATPQQLPLGPRDTIVCSTCHNPHERGVFPEDSMLAAGASVWRPGEQGRKLRGRGEDICSGCHEQY